MAACVDLLRLFVSLAGITNRALRSDLGIAAVLAEATVRAGRWNGDVNLAFLGDEAEKKRAGETAGTLVAEAGRLCAETEKACGA